MICKHCGKETPDEGAFCLFCGKPLEKAPANDQPVNMWGEPIQTLTKEFETPAPLTSTEEDVSTTRVVPSTYTDMSSGAAPAEPPAPPKEERKGNRRLIIGIVAATAVVLVLVMLFFILKVIMPDSEEDATSPKKFEYVVMDNNTVHIQSYIGTEDTVVIPSRIEKKAVTAILAKAFANRNLLAVTVPDSVTVIDATAFEGNPDLVLFGTKNAYVKLFAEKNNLAFALKGTTPTTTRPSITDTTTTTTSTLPATTTDTTSSTSSTTQTEQTAGSATYAKTTAAPTGTDPQTPAINLLGKGFEEVKGLLGGQYKIMEGGLNFPYHSQVEFSNFVGQAPSASSHVVGVTITDGHITPDARIGYTLEQLRVMLTNTSEWDVQPQAGIGQRASFHMAYNGQVVDVILYFSGEGESAHCIQAYVGELPQLSAEDNALLGQE